MQQIPDCHEPATDDVFIYSLDFDEVTTLKTNYHIKSTPAPFTMSKPLPQGCLPDEPKLHLKWKKRRNADEH